VEGALQAGGPCLEARALVAQDGAPDRRVVRREDGADGRQ
jgi:hypothetical protein